MERDFLGLNSNKTYVTVNEETTNEAKNSVLLLPRSSSSGMQWSFSNKGSAVPQYLSFKACQEDNPRNNVHDASSFMTISTGDAYDSSQKSFSSTVQKNFMKEKQAGNNSMTVYPMQHLDKHSIYRPQEVKIYPGANQFSQTIPISLSTPVLQNHSVGQQKMVGSTIKSQPLAGVPVLTPVSVLPPKSSVVVGTTDLRSSNNSSGVPAQLTIFYAGSVSVYHDISPEKAQAIMLLAGNGSSPAHNKTPSTAQVQTPFPSPSTFNGFYEKRSHIASSIPGLASPLSMASHTSSRPGGAISSNEIAIVKPVATSASPINHSGPSTVVSSLQSVMTNLIQAVPVPQARKASLARFFEKRKERMTAALPYNLSKKSSSSCPPQATT